MDGVDGAILGSRGAAHGLPSTHLAVSALIFDPGQGLSASWTCDRVIKRKEWPYWTMLSHRASLLSCARPPGVGSSVTSSETEQFKGTDQRLDGNHFGGG